MDLNTSDATSWALPSREPVTDAAIDRAIAAEEVASASEHRASVAWFDPAHDAVLVMLTDGRVFGARRDLVPSLRRATHPQLRNLRATRDGMFLTLEALDLHISVDGLVTRLLADSPAAVRRAAARLAGRATSPAKALSSAHNGRLGGRPRKAAPSA